MFIYGPFQPVVTSGEDDKFWFDDQTGKKERSLCLIINNAYVNGLRQ